MRRLVAEHDHGALLEILERASAARRALGERAPSPEELVEVRIPVPDRKGVIAEVAVVITELGINIVDLEIAHSVAGNGVLLVVVDQLSAPTLVATLTGRGYQAFSNPVGSSR
jgi:prephenate dehydrogenase